MIKLFNTIRKSLISENKFTKYILYAFGEIILVVIGILIALSINKYNEQRKKEVKLNSLLLEIQSELAISINQFTRGIEYYEFKDSIISQIFSGKLKSEDYINNPSLAYPIVNYNMVTINDNAYLNLVQVSDILPEAYNDTFEELKTVYESDKEYLDLTQQKFTDFIFKFISHLSDTKDWYINYFHQNDINEEILNYLVNDPFYKNKVLDYTIYFNNLYLNQKKTNAVLAYKSLANITGNDSHISPYYFPNQEELSELSGNFELQSESLVFTKDGKRNFCSLRAENTQLYIKLFGTSEYELFPHTQDTFIFGDGDNAQVKFIFNEDNSISEIQLYNESEYTQWNKIE